MQAKNPQNTAVAKAAVTQAGYSIKNAYCCSGGMFAIISSVANAMVRYAITPIKFHNSASTLAIQNQTGGLVVEVDIDH